MRLTEKEMLDLATFVGLAIEEAPAKLGTPEVDIPSAGGAAYEIAHLTGKEILDLVLGAGKAAGFTIEENSIEPDILETLVTVVPCPKRGLLYEEEEEGDEPRFYRHIAYLSEYPEEGVIPLGLEISPEEAATLREPVTPPAQEALANG